MTVAIFSAGLNLNAPALAPVVVSIPPSVKIGAVLFSVCKEYEPSGCVKAKGSPGSYTLFKFKSWNTLAPEIGPLRSIPPKRAPPPAPKAPKIPPPPPPQLVNANKLTVDNNETLISVLLNF